MHTHARAHTHTNTQTDDTVIHYQTAPCFSSNEGNLAAYPCLCRKPNHGHPKAQRPRPSTASASYVHHLFYHTESPHSAHAMYLRILRTNSLYCPKQHKRLVFVIETLFSVRYELNICVLFSRNQAPHGLLYYLC
jgi:hypothetical protein